MKSLLLSSLALMVLTTAVVAQRGERSDRPQGADDRRPGAERRHPLREFLLRRFDRDHDGRLDPRERRAILQRLRERLEAGGPRQGVRDGGPDGARGEGRRPPLRGTEGRRLGRDGAGPAPTERMRPRRPGRDGPETRRPGADEPGADGPPSPPTEGERRPLRRKTAR